MTTVRQLIPVGELRDGDTVPYYCTVRWLLRGGGMVRFGPTNEYSAQQACLPADMEIWVERDVLVPGALAVAPLSPVAQYSKVS